MADDPAVEALVLGELARLGVVHTVIPCDPTFADTAAFCERYGYAADDSANTIIVAARREPGVACACVALASTRLDVNHTVCELLGVRKASFASAEATQDLTGMSIGGVTPFGLPAELRVFIDANVMRRPRVILGGGSRAIKLQMAPDELARLPSALVVEGLARTA